MVTMREIWERQGKLASARSTLEMERDRVHEAVHAGDMPGLTVVEDVAAVRDARLEVEALEAEVGKLQDEVGGKVFRIALEKLDGVKTSIDKMNVRARKLGVPEIAFTVTEETETEKRLLPGYDPQIDNADDWTVYVHFTFCVLDGKAPKLDGWSFVAALDHDTAGGALPIIKRSPRDEAQGVDLDSYRRAENVCDHCGYKRDRLKTYIVVHDDGRTMQVGSTCIKDFLGGVSPERIARWSESVWDLFDEVGGAEGYDMVEGGGGYDRHSIDLRRFLTLAAASARVEGWRSRWIDGERHQGTADEALHLMHSRAKQDRDWVSENVTDDDAAAVDAALEWLNTEVAERDDLSEFEHNMVAICGDGRTWIKYGDAGIAAFLPQMHARHLGKVAERKVREKANAALADSEHIAAEGDRVKLTFTVIFNRGFDGYYGTRYLTKGLTPDGNLIMWWGSGNAASQMEEGDTVSCTATIKAHSTDKFSGDAKITEIGNARSVKWLEEDEVPTPDEVEVEVTATAEERAMEREARERREAERAEEAEREARRQRIIEAEEQAAAEEDDEGLECLDHDEHCAGRVEYRHALSATGKSFPRCEFHWEERLESQAEIQRKYGGVAAPAGFDPGYAGESWDEQ